MLFVERTTLHRLKKKSEDTGGIKTSATRKTHKQEKFSQVQRRGREMEGGVSFDFFI